MDNSPQSYAAQKRIAIVCHAHPSVSKGGAEIAAYTLFQGLRTLGHDPLFIASVPAKDRGRVALGSSRERAIFFEPTGYDHFFNLSTPGPLDELRAIITAEDIQIVNFQHFMNFGIGTVRAVGSMPGVTSFMTLHEYLAICFNHGQMITNPAKVLCETSNPQACWTCFPEHTRQQFALRKSLFLDAFAAMQGFISPSRFLAQRFTDWGLPPEKISVIENGLPAHTLRPPPRPRHEATPWVIGFFGQINPFKGVDTVLKAVEIIGKSKTAGPRIQLRIHGNFVGQSEAFIARFNKLIDKFDCLTYAGPYENATVGRLMTECDYVLVPSTWWENSPVVIQEAYAAGRPVICTGIGGMAEKVIDGVTGLHFRIGDAADLVHVMETAASVETLAKLTTRIPQVTDAAAMAQAYLMAFQGSQSAQAPADDDKEDAISLTKRRSAARS